MPRILYKYLDITGAKYMIGATKPITSPNLQFTNASQLNDPFDCHPKLLDHSHLPADVLRVPDEEYHKFMVEKSECDAENMRNDTWLCSLSKVNDSILMWSHYCQNHSGICIGLNMEKVHECVPQMFSSIYCELLEYEVQYKDIVERPTPDRSPWDYQLCTKADDWKYEQEVRLITHKPSRFYEKLSNEQIKAAERGEIIDGRAVRQYMPLNGDCFDSIYFGINIAPEEKDKIIRHVRTTLNPNCQLYQMAIDANAFRLKVGKID